MTNGEILQGAATGPVMEQVPGGGNEDNKVVIHMDGDGTLQQTMANTVDIKGTATGPVPEEVPGGGNTTAIPRRNGDMGN